MSMIKLLKWAVFIITLWYVYKNYIATKKTVKPVPPIQQQTQEIMND